MRLLSYLNPLLSLLATLHLAGGSNAYSILKIWFRLSSRLLQLHDRNSRRQFTSSEDFHAREGVDEYFITEVSIRECFVNAASQFS